MDARTRERASTSSTPPTSTAALEKKGWTEEIVGRWFAQGGGRRERTVLATKVYGDMGGWPNQGRLSAHNIRQALDASLRRLQTDHIDLYQFHHVDRDTPWDEIWEAIEVAVSAGKILYAGSSNFAGWHIALAQGVAARRHYLGLVSEQSIYNLINRAVELEVLPAARYFGLGVIPWSPLAGGLLGGVLRGERDGKRRYDGARVERHRDQLERFESLAEELGQQPGRRRAGLAPGAACGDRADHRAADDGAAGGGAARTRRGARSGDPGPARRDLPRAQDGARGLRLVGVTE